MKSACCRAIDNYAYLVKKYCLEEAGLDPKSTYLLETVRAMSSLTDAEVCWINILLMCVLANVVEICETLNHVKGHGVRLVGCENLCL
jgi:hypothetical protein